MEGLRGFWDILRFFVFRRVGYGRRIIGERVFEVIGILFRVMCS